MSDWLLRQTYGFGSARIALCAEPHAAASAEWNFREGVRQARACAGNWRDLFGLAPAFALALAVAVAPLLALMQQSLTAQDVEMIFLATPARSDPPPARAIPLPPPIAVAEEIPPPPPPAEPAPAEPIEPPVVAVARPIPPPPPSPRPPPRIEPVAFAAPPAETAPWRSVRSLASTAPAAVARPALFHIDSLAPGSDPAPSSANARAGRTAPEQNPRTPPPPVRFAAAFPAAPEASVAIPTRQPLRPERPSERTGAETPRESKPGVSAVALASLASCRSDAQEDNLKQRVLAQVGNRGQCESKAGRYVFVETRNLNAFLMYVQRSEARGEADRCVELSLALDCLTQQGGPKAGRV